MLNTTSTESRIKLNESSITIAICSKTFSSENMSYTTLLSSKCQKFSSSSKHRARSPHTRIRSRHTLKMSEKMSDISSSVNQLINQSQPIRSVNQLISRHQSFKTRHHLFRHHSDKHLFNHYILIYHTIHSTLQSISSITSTINHSTDQSISIRQPISTRPPNHRGHRTRSIKFGSLRKHLNRIYLNQFNLHLHLNHRNHRNHLHLHSRPHQHLNLPQNQFSSINHTPRTIGPDNWHYWTKSIRRTKNSVTRAAILIIKC